MLKMILIKVAKHFFTEENLNKAICTCYEGYLKRKTKKG